MSADQKFPHLNVRGEVHMVSVGGKDESDRRARAMGRLETTPEVVESIRAGTTAKGDVLAVARVAAILGVKRTSEWIPLAHPIPVTGVSVDIVIEEKALVVSVEVSTVGRTGVEMEALTGVSAALLTLYDMLKAQDRAMVMTEVKLMAKSGGRSGVFQREDDVHG